MRKIIAWKQLKENTKWTGCIVRVFARKQAFKPLPLDWPLHAMERVLGSYRTALELTWDSQP